MKKIVIIAVIVLLFFITFTSGYFLGSKVNNKDDKINNLNEIINSLNERISELEKNNIAVVIKQVDGQVFVMKSDNRMYCQLGVDKNGNMIETTVYNDECIITQPICELLQSSGTVFFDENPKFLEKCQ